MVSVGTVFNSYAPIVKSDTVNFDGSTYSATPAVNPKPCKAIYVGGAGIVVAVQSNGTAVNFTAVAGEILPIAAIRVNSTTTSASLMVAMYQN